MYCIYWPFLVCTVPSGRVSGRISGRVIVYTAPYLLYPSGIEKVDI